MIKTKHLKYVAILAITASLLIVVVEDKEEPSEPTVPSVIAVEGKLRTLLSDARYSDCPGYPTLYSLSILNIGEYSEEVGGWPVFASYELSCRGRSGTTRFHNLRGLSPIAYVREDAAGELELFMYGTSLDARQEIRDHMRAYFKRAVEVNYRMTSRCGR